MIINLFLLEGGEGRYPTGSLFDQTLVLYLLRLRCIKITTKALVFAVLVQINISFIAQLFLCLAAV